MGGGNAKTKRNEMVLEWIGPEWTCSRLHWTKLGAGGGGGGGHTKTCKSTSRWRMINNQQLFFLFSPFFFFFFLVSSRLGFWVRVYDTERFIYSRLCRRRHRRHRRQEPEG